MKSVRSLAGLASLAAASILPVPAHAAGVTSATRAHAAVLHPLSLVLKGDLDFGMIAVNGAGSVVIEPNANLMTTSGGVVALGGSPTAASFVGAAGSSSVVIIRIPKQPIRHYPTGGTETMSVRNFTLRRPGQARSGSAEASSSASARRSMSPPTRSRASMSERST